MTPDIRPWMLHSAAPVIYEGRVTRGKLGSMLVGVHVANTFWLKTMNDVNEHFQGVHEIYGMSEKHDGLPHYILNMLSDEDFMLINDYGEMHFFQFLVKTYNIRDLGLLLHREIKEDVDEQQLLPLWR